MALVSMYEDLTKLSDTRYPATDLIAYLVGQIGHDACEAKRNTQTAYRVVSRGREIHDQITQRITEFQQTDGHTLTESWEDYSKPIEAIDPTEEFVHAHFSAFILTLSTGFQMASQVC